MCGIAAVIGSCKSLGLSGDPPVATVCNSNRNCGSHHYDNNEKNRSGDNRNVKLDRFHERDDDCCCSCVAPILAHRGPDVSRSCVYALSSQHHQQDTQEGEETTGILLSLFAAVLHMRGGVCVDQPFVSQTTGNVLLWNGEVFSGSFAVCML